MQPLIPTEKDKQNRNLLFLAVAIIGLVAFLFLHVNEQKKLETLRIEQAEEARAAKIYQEQANIIGRIPVIAKSVSVYDISEGRKIYGKNDDVAMPLASLTKTMTVIVSLLGRKEDDTVIMPKDAINQDGDYGMFENEKWNVSDLAKATLIVSANDGAYALAKNTPEYLDKMNTKAKRLGMENTLFLNPTGLDVITPEGPKAGAVASAFDANILSAFALRAEPEIFSATTLPEISLKSESGFNHTFKNTDTALDKIPNLIFSKTGFTNVAGGNLSIIFRDKNYHKIGVTILGSTYEGRFDDMVQIVDAINSFKD